MTVCKVLGDCRARSNKTIPCDGDFQLSQGLCLRHACLFDIWIAEHDGHRVYSFKGSTRAEEDHEQLRRWKRAKFHAWLDTLNVAWVQEKLKS